MAAALATALEPSSDCRRFRGGNFCAFMPSSCVRCDHDVRPAILGLMKPSQLARWPRTSQVTRCGSQSTPSIAHAV
jgi:hypothetical protein